jgi:hypothetical protein
VRRCAGWLGFGQSDATVGNAFWPPQKPEKRPLMATKRLDLPRQPRHPAASVHCLERSLSGPSETHRLIEAASARLRQGIGGDADRAADQTPACRDKLQEAAWCAKQQTLSSSDLLSLATALPAEITVDGSGLDSGCVFSPPLSKVVLNLVLLAAECLPAGGSVMLAGSARDLFLRIDGPEAGWPPGMGACLVDEGAAAAAMTRGDHVQMALTMLLAHAFGIRLSYLLAPSARGVPPILRVGGN